MAQLSEQLDALTADYTHMHPTRMTVSTTQRLIRDAPWRLPIDVSGFAGE